MIWQLPRQVEWTTTLDDLSYVVGIHIMLYLSYLSSSYLVIPCEWSLEPLAGPSYKQPVYEPGVYVACILFA